LLPRARHLYSAAQLRSQCAQGSGPWSPRETRATFFFVLGDSFPKDKDDIEHFSARSALIQELHIVNAGPWAYRVKVLRKNE
jgi:hypothetical protein